LISGIRAQCIATLSAIDPSPWAVYEKDLIGAEPSNPSVVYDLDALFTVADLDASHCEAYCSVSYKYSNPDKSVSECPIVVSTTIVNEASKDGTMQFSFEIDKGFDDDCDDGDKSYL